MSTNKKMPAQPDEVGEVEEVNSSARVVAPAPSVEGRLNIQIQLQARDHIQFDVQFDVQILQSADGSYVFPMLNDIKTLLFVNIDKYLKETMQTAETSLRAALDSGGPYTQVTYIPRGGRSGASVTAGQPSVGHALLGRYGELLTEYLAREAARMCRYLLNRYTKPMGPMHMQPPAANEWFSRPTRRQLPEPRTDYQQYRQTFLDAASLPQPAPRQVLQQSQVRGPYGLFTTMNPDSEHNRILLPPLEPKHIGEQNPMAPGLVIKEHIPLSRVTREEAPIPVTLPPVARLIEQVEALEKGEEIDVLGSAFQTNNDNYAMSTDKDVEMKDAGAIDGDAPTHDGSTGSQAKLPGLSENFANDAFMQENVADQPHHPTGVKRAYDNYVTEQGQKAVQPHLTKTMSRGETMVPKPHDYNPNRLVDVNQAPNTNAPTDNPAPGQPSVQTHPNPQPPAQEPTQASNPGAMQGVAGQTQQAQVHQTQVQQTLVNQAQRLQVQAQRAEIHHLLLQQAWLQQAQAKQTQLYVAHMERFQTQLAELQRKLRQAFAQAPAPAVPQAPIQGALPPPIHGPVPPPFRGPVPPPMHGPMPPPNEFRVQLRGTAQSVTQAAAPALTQVPTGGASGQAHTQRATQAVTQAGTATAASTTATNAAVPGHGSGSASGSAPESGQQMSSNARGKQIARSNRVYKHMEKGESSRGAGSE